MRVNELCDELEERVKKDERVVLKGTPGILISGSLLAIPNWKLHAIIERQINKKIIFPEKI